MNGVGTGLAAQIASNAEAQGDCLVWLGRRGGRGYGKVEIDGRFIAVHRVLYAASTNTVLTRGARVEQTCGNRLCVNFNHLAMRGAGLEGCYVVDEGGCWLWTMSVDRDGYGLVGRDRKVWKAHRYSWVLANGPTPDGTELDHLCRVRRCINPAHLEPVTHAVNILRGDSPQAHNARKTHCKHGHEFTERNTYVHDGGRYCRACTRANTARYVARRAGVVA